MNIELVEDSSKAKVFRTQCKCLSKEHDLWVTIEYDKKLEDVSMTFQYSLPLSHQIKSWNYGFFKSIWEKIKIIFKVIFNMPVKFEEAFLFRDMGHIKDFSDIVYILSKEVRKETKDNEFLTQEVNRLKERLSKYEKRK